MQESPHQVEQPSPLPHLAVTIHRKDFFVSGTVLEVLRGLHFEVEKRAFVTLLGPSGCGKSTLLRLIAGLDTDYVGTISLDGETIRGPGPDRGIVFQESRLLPWFTVEQNVAFALPPGTDMQHRQSRIDHVLRLVDLVPFRKAWPHQLSGGMEKRVALARALVNIPSLLLLDEPFSALDTFTKYGLQDELARLHAMERTTTVLITHDIDEAVYLSDLVAVLASSPATIRTICPVPLPRPRLRTSQAFGQLRAEILNRVLSPREIPDNPD